MAKVTRDVPPAAAVGEGQTQPAEYWDGLSWKPAPAGQSIIDRDIAFYEGEAERLATELRRCAPDDEPFTRCKLDAARDVVAALNIYAFRLNGEV